jgi:putative DNA primase/helicase
MSLANVRLVGCQEVDEGRAFAESLIKEMTGSDMITGRKLYQNEWSYRPEFALWLGVNHLPHVQGTDEGIWRRLCIIECKASFRDKPDRDLPRRLLQEAPGIWTRIAMEAQAWMREGLALPREVVAASLEYRGEEDPLRDFLERYCVLEQGARGVRGDLYAAYEEYCTAYRVPKMSDKKFYSLFRKKFGKDTKGTGSTGYVFKGVRVKTNVERFDASPKAILQRALKRRTKSAKEPD